MQASKVINIQFLRAVAALMVVFYHTADHYFVVGGNTSGNIFSFMSKVGYIGVDIFFVISGYIMWISTKEKHGLKDAINFLYSRLARVYLGYWIFLAMMIYYYHKSLYNFDLLGSIFLTASSSSKLLLQVAWTLQYELYFYIFFTILLFFPRKYFAYILWILSFFIIGVQLYGVVIYNIYDKSIFNGASTFYTFWTSPYLLEFFMGAFVAYYFERNRINNIWLVGIFIFAWIGLALWCQTHCIQGSLSQGYYLPQRIFFFGFVSMGVLALAVELDKREISILPAFSSCVGGASYTLYLSHTIILLFIYEIGIRDKIKEIGEYQQFFMIVIIILMVLYSFMHYVIVEKRIMQFSKDIQGKYLQKLLNRIS